MRNDCTAALWFTRIHWGLTSRFILNNFPHTRCFLFCISSCVCGDRTREELDRLQTKPKHQQHSFWWLGYKTQFLSVFLPLQWQSVVCCKSLCCSWRRLKCWSGKKNQHAKIIISEQLQKEVLTTVSWGLQTISVKTLTVKHNLSSGPRGFPGDRSTVFQNLFSPSPALREDLWEERHFDPVHLH